MNRTQLEHAIRASTTILAQDRVNIVGSQSILGTWDANELPGEATASVEVDVCPMHDDDAESLADVLDGAIGELSDFHQTHGFYIQGVGRTTSRLAPGWVDRLVPVTGPGTQGATGLCLDPDDLCAAKILAHREKDQEFVRALIVHQMVDPNVVLERVQLTDVPEEVRDVAVRWLVPHCTHWDALGLATVPRGAR